jgi:DNA (cytosine-5)-methyltransferase 1
VATFGSLFAGIGGIDLGLERAGWECRFQVEWDAYCQRVLAKHWPDVPRYGDITAVNWSGVERVDLLAGGFPCQPFSLAGQRRGKSDDRWLWPAFADAIRALRPCYVLVENVPGLLAGHGGMGSVLGDLADLGYDAEWDSVPAAAVGAPHLRYRVWIVAYSRGDRRDRGTERYRLPTEWQRPAPRRDDAAGCADPVGGCADAPYGSLADSDDSRRDGRTWEQWTSGRSEPSDSGLEDAHGGPLESRRRRGRAPEASELADPDQFQPRLGGRERQSGDSDRQRHLHQWSVEPDVGRVAHGVPARVDRLRALGNAVVPQVVEVIGRQLLQVFEGNVTP